MADTLKPRSVKEVEDAVLWALGDGKTLEIAGEGTKAGIGRPAQTDLTLDLRALSGVTLYEPEELVLTAKAGTPLAEIEALVEENNQELAFEPIHYAALFGDGRSAGTIGGAIAANLSGPRRIKAGAARDHLLGATAVTGRGETIKSGGRVVKNVTGYDLCKVLAGSWGTLAAMTEMTIKVLPKAEAEATVVIGGLSDADAAKAMAAAMGSPFDVSGAAHLPDHVASHFAGLPGVDAATALRIEGFAPSVKHRVDALATIMKPFGAIAVLGEKESRALWRDVRDVKAFAAPAVRDRPLWRISTAPMRGHEIAARITPAAQMFYDWGGGLVWVAMPYAGEADAASIRDAVKAIGGHATLVRAPHAVRAALDVFEPQGAGIAGLTKRVKEAFDPKAVFNPGRMWAGV